MVDYLQICDQLISRLRPLNADFPSVKAANSVFDFQFAMGRTLLARDAGLVISVVPKNASSSLKLAIIESDFPEIAASYLSLQDLIDDVHRFDGLLTVKNFSDMTGTETVRVVRDPLRRAVSAYYNKFVEDVETSIVKDVCGFLGKDPADVSFESFVWYLTNAPSYWLDPHFRPQVDFFVFERYNYTFVQEQAELLQSFIESRMGVPLRHANDRRVRGPIAEPMIYCGALPAKFFSELYENGQPSRSWQDFLSPKVESALRARYRDDFILYEAAIDKLKK